MDAGDQGPLALAAGEGGERTGFERGDPDPVEGRGDEGGVGGGVGLPEPLVRGAAHRSNGGMQHPSRARPSALARGTP